MNITKRISITDRIENYQKNGLPYDKYGNWYIRHIQGDPGSVIPAHTSVIPPMLELLPTDFYQLRLLDICCGSGAFTRALIKALEEAMSQVLRNGDPDVFLRRKCLWESGEASITGVDISRVLIGEAEAEERRSARHTTKANYMLDNAMELSTQPSDSIDVITCCLGLTDIPDEAPASGLRAAFSAVHRVLKPGGTFVYSIIHPAALCSKQSGELECQPGAYHEPGFRLSNNPTSVRGIVGWTHRPLWLYVKKAQEVGLVFETLIESAAPYELIEKQPAYRHTPYGLIVKVRKPEAKSC